MTAHANTIVVGGGIVGAATAYFLSRKGVRVTLIEANTDEATDFDAGLFRLDRPALRANNERHGRW